MSLTDSLRPDMPFAVCECAWFMHCPRKEHVMAIKKICCYLNGTQMQALMI